MTPQISPPKGSPTEAQSGSPLANLNLRHVSLGAPVIAQIGGKSLAVSCDDQTRRRLGRLGGSVQAKELVQASIEPRLTRHAAYRQHHAGYVGFATRRAVRDSQRLPWQSEDHLLVGDETGQPDAVHGDTALLPTPRPCERLLLGLLVAEGIVAAPRREAPGCRQRGAGWRIELDRVVHLDNFGCVEMRRGDFCQ